MQYTHTYGSMYVFFVCVCVHARTHIHTRAHTHTMRGHRYSGRNNDAQWSAAELKYFVTRVAEVILGFARQNATLERAQEALCESLRGAEGRDGEWVLLDKTE